MDWVGSIHPYTPQRPGNAALEVKVAAPIRPHEFRHDLPILLAIRRSSVQGRVGILWGVEEDQTNPVLATELSDPIQCADVRRQRAAAERSFGCGRDAEKVDAHQIQN